MAHYMAAQNEGLALLQWLKNLPWRCCPMRTEACPTGFRCTEGCRHPWPPSQAPCTWACGSSVFHGYENDFGAVDKEGRSARLRQLDPKQVARAANCKPRPKKCATGRQPGRAGAHLPMHCALVTGMGNPHPLESGFTWHPTLGMPYLPGSAVGLVRAV